MTEQRATLKSSKLIAERFMGEVARALLACARNQTGEPRHYYFVTSDPRAAGELAKANNRFAFCDALTLELMKELVAERVQHLNERAAAPSSGLRGTFSFSIEHDHVVLWFDGE